MLPEHFPRYTRVSLRDHWDGVRRSDVEAGRMQLLASILGDLVGSPWRQSPQPPQWREPPLLLAPGRHRKLIQRERLVLVQPGHGGRRLHGPLERRHQPTAPSI